MFVPGAGPSTSRFLLALLAQSVILGLSQVSYAKELTTLDLEPYRGKVVVVDFWASWCKPCRQSIPWLNEMRTRYGSEGLVVIGVNVDAKQGDASRFLREVPADFDIVYDPGGQLAEHYHVTGMPASFVYDRSGHLAEQHLGFRDADRAPYEAAIQKLLASSGDKT